MAEACVNGAIELAISFHILRHTWASLAVMNGTPLLVVAKNLGHTDTRMVYGRLAPSLIVDAIRARHQPVRAGLSPGRSLLEHSSLATIVIRAAGRRRTRKRSKLTEAQIAFALRQAVEGTAARCMGDGDQRGNLLQLALEVCDAVGDEGALPYFA
jgi:hypothetical protein